MDKDWIISRMEEKLDLEGLTDEVLENSQVLEWLIEMVDTEPSSIKYGCTKVLRMASEVRPEKIYPYFDQIAKWVHHKNSFIKWDGIRILSNLAGVDRENQFETIYEEYFSLIREPQMITASNVVGNVWKIVLAKPELDQDITQRLLEVPKFIYLYKGKPSPECNRIVCGKVLESFEQYYDVSKYQDQMMEFARKQLGNSRKSVAKYAEKFLKAHQGSVE